MHIALKIIYGNFGRNFFYHRYEEELKYIQYRRTAYAGQKGGCEEEKIARSDFILTYFLHQYFFYIRINLRPP